MTIPKILSVVAGAALCAVLTACGPSDGSSPSTEPGPAVSAPETGETALTPGDLYLAAARTVAPDLMYVTDADLRDLGEAVCGAFDAGATTVDVGTTMIGSGLDATASGAVVGAATSTLCPEHEDAARGL